MDLDVTDGIIIWFCMWFLFWGVYNYVLFPRGVDYIKKYFFTFVYFIAAAAILARLFRNYFFPAVADFDILPFYILAAAIAANFGLHYLARRLRYEPDFARTNEHAQFLSLDFRYFLAKSANILFQQVLIVLLALILSGAGLGLSGVMVAFGVIFVLGHMPLLDIDGRDIGWFFIFGAAVGAVVFPALILRINYGFIYTFILHQLFYTMAAFIFWIYAGAKRA